MTPTTPNNSSSARAERVWSFMTPLVLATAVIVQAAIVRAETSPTYDESTYLRLGLQAIREGTFAEFIKFMIPPMTALIGSAWPALTNGGVTTESIGHARAVLSTVVGIPMVLAVTFWLARRRGWAAGALGGTLMAFSPSILAHASLATTDAGFALGTLIALAALVWYRVQPSPGRLAASGAAIGLALAMKQSAIFLFPVSLIWLADIELARSDRPIVMQGWLRAAARVAGRLLVVVGLAFLVDWALYGFASGPLLDADRKHGVVTRVFGAGPQVQAILARLEQWRVPASINTVLRQFGHGLGGHPAFFMGQRSDHGGFRLFFPVAFAIKSTPAELILAVLTPLVWLRHRSWRDLTVRLWGLSFAVFAGMAMMSSLNNGHRYILVLYPLLILLGVDGLAVATSGASRRFAVMAGALAAIQVGSAVTVAPEYLAYFNAAVGGPSQGYRYLVDSSLDWGQDLPALHRTLDQLGTRQVALAYFGTADAKDFGIDPVPWDDPDPTRVGLCRYLAVSATYLQGVYLPDDPFSGLRALPPIARSGPSLFLYDLGDPAVRAAFDQARTSAGRDRARPVVIEK